MSAPGHPGTHPPQLSLRVGPNNDQGRMKSKGTLMIMNDGDEGLEGFLFERLVYTGFQMAKSVLCFIVFRTLVPAMISMLLNARFRSVVVLRFDTLDDRLLLLALPAHVLRDTCPDPFPSCQPHSRLVQRLVIPETLEDGTLDGNEFGVILRPHKVQDPVTVDVGLIRRRCDHPMDTALQEPVRQELQGVCYVDGDALRVRLDVLPFTFGRADLQRGHGLSDNVHQSSPVQR